MTADLPLLTIGIGLAALALSGAVVVFLRRDGDGGAVPPLAGAGDGGETDISPELTAVLQRRTLRRGRVPVDTGDPDEGERA